MDAIARKDAARKFKARKPPCGVYAVRSTTTGQVWVGSFANLEAMRNRLWFSLHQRHPAIERDTGSSRALLAARKL